ncbi:hypothetical protein MKK69_02830, partial [Methylobacterium sp. J-026]|uniref:hypothetical protein n=1 Tax=Methylobacterium sp. J-026 TaxID=2836624 RepID=UPI001FBA9738
MLSLYPCKKRSRHKGICLGNLEPTRLARSMHVGNRCRIIAVVAILMIAGFYALWLVNYGCKVLCSFRENKIDLDYRSIRSFQHWLAIPS